MNIILANVRTKTPAVHRANAEGKPLCGAVHSAVIPFIGLMENRRKQKAMKAAGTAKGQAEMKLGDSHRPLAVWESLTPDKVKPNEEYIQDIGDITCKACLTKIKKDSHA